MLRIAICDDDPHLCQQLMDMLLALSPDTSDLIPVIDIFSNGETLLSFMDLGHRYDLLFLDIELGGLRGVDVAHTIRHVRLDNRIHIVYISSQESYAMELFKTRPLDFLIKPLRSEQVKTVLDTSRFLLHEENHTLSFLCDRNVVTLRTSDILYLESRLRKITIFLTHRSYTSYGKINDVMAQLPPYQFIQIHQSFIVNYAHVTAWDYEDVTLQNGVCLPVSQSRRKAVRTWLLARRKGGLHG